MHMAHYSDVIMSIMASEITSLTIVYSTVCSGADQRKHQTSASEGNPQVTVGFPHKGPVMRKMFTFDDVITISNSDWVKLCENKIVLEVTYLANGMNRRRYITWFHPHILNPLTQCPRPFPDWVFAYKRSGFRA